MPDWPEKQPEGLSALSMESKITRPLLLALKYPGEREGQRPSFPRQRERYSRAATRRAIDQAGSACEFILHHRTHLSEIHLASIFFLERRHYTAHVAQTFGAGFCNRIIYGTGDFVSAQLAGQEVLNDRDFLALLLGQLQATAILISAGTFMALLDHARQDGADIGILDGIGAAIGTCRDVTILDSGIDQPQGGKARGVLGFHRLFEGYGDFGSDIHGFHLQSLKEQVTHIGVRKPGRNATTT